MTIDAVLLTKIEQLSNAVLLINEKLNDLPRLVVNEIINVMQQQQQNEFYNCPDSFPASAEAAQYQSNSPIDKSQHADCNLESFPPISVVQPTNLPLNLPQTLRYRKPIITYEKKRHPIKSISVEPNVVKTNCQPISTKFEEQLDHLKKDVKVEEICDDQANYESAIMYADPDLDSSETSLNLEPTPSTSANSNSSSKLIRKRKSYDLNYKMYVVNYANLNKSNRLAARAFGIEEKMVRSWRKDEAKFQKAIESGGDTRRKLGSGRRSGNQRQADKSGHVGYSQSTSAQQYAAFDRNLQYENPT